MKLPFFADILTDPRRSTYYTFSKANHDLDRCAVNGSKYVFTKMVALNLPIWDPSKTVSNFQFKFRRSDNAISPGDITAYTVELSKPFPDLEVTNWTDPNMVIPRMFQYYTENVIFSYCKNTDIRSEMSAEHAFWKTMLKMGMTVDDIKKSIVFVNDVATVNFVEVSNNHGWCEIVASIPNRCSAMDISSAINNTNGSETLTGIENSPSICDIPSPPSIQTDVMNISFDNIVFDSTSAPKKFNFNTILLFYTDGTKNNDKVVHKLHGVDFLLPFAKQDSGIWELPSFEHHTNDSQTFGYSFKFNMKTITNDATKEHIYNENQDTFYHVFQGAMDKFASFLELVSKNPII